MDFAALVWTPTPFDLHCIGFLVMLTSRSAVCNHHFTRMYTQSLARAANAFCSKDRILLKRSYRAPRPMKFTRGLHGARSLECSGVPCGPQGLRTHVLAFGFHLNPVASHEVRRHPMGFQLGHRGLVPHGVLFTCNSYERKR